MIDRSYTYIEDIDFHVCNDCGAVATEKDEVQHYRTCKPGDAQRWEEYYSQSVSDEYEEYIKPLESKDD